MTEKEHFLERHSILNYQHLINKHNGTGILKYENNKEYPCKFEVGQLVNGNIVFTCECSNNYINDFNEEISLYTVQKFKIVEGLTNKNENVAGRISIFTGLSLGLESFELSGFLNEMTVKTNIKENLQRVVFGLTNFVFNEEVLTLDLEGMKRLQIKKIDKYKDALNFLKTFKAVCVTCEVTVNISKEEEIENIKSVVSDLCAILSVAQGRNIQWIYYNVYDKEENITSQGHENRVTKPYCSLEIIDERSETMEKFIEMSYKAFAKDQFLLRNNKYIINAYIDSKLTNDYLEQRGLKLSLVTELFKELLLKTKPEFEYIINEENFKKIKPDIKKAFKDILVQNVDSTSRNKMYKNVSGLNRTPFHDILSCFCKYINLQIEADDLQLIIKIRNSLVHTGTFFCRNTDCTDDDIRKYPQLKSPATEYFFLLNFVDKCFLKLLCYKGLYINWSNPNEIKEEELI
ncbi:hypothetical protein MSKOL_2725 [Methanosarcina sp. Kolksee]|uniref:hypothetical protein n=1 Tax=Methanosarcina sp. Kolksee TaxID=1434099 RepID=UPI000615F7CF|nr:hypothetical protein [Methanosarcina sp. Kolksee]AKB48502.1 hypothetical protein MSKOL_2725 [Methanosarcina sp. Kolksee]